MGLIIQGDLHFSETTYSKLPQMWGDTEFALQQLVNRALRHNHDIVLAGDYLDTKTPKAILLRTFFRILKAALDVGRKVYVVQGQHDMGKIPFACILDHPNIIWLNKQLVQTDIGDVYGLDYQPRTILADEIAKVPPCVLLVLHQMGQEACDHGPKDDLNVRSWDMTFGDVPQHAEFIIAGDYHAPLDGITDGRKWAYTGSATIRSFTEPQNKSFIELTSDGTNISMVRIPLLTRPMLYVEAEYEHELGEKLAKVPPCVEELTTKALEAGVPEEVAVPFCVVRYASDIPNAAGATQDALRLLIEHGLVHLHYKTMPRGNRSRTGDIEGGQVLSINEAVDLCVDSEAAPKMHKFVSELANTRDPNDVIHSVKVEYDVDALTARI
jgi:hypothetical protein